MAVSLRLTIPGEPIPKARPRVVNGHTYTDARTVAAEQKIGWLAREAWGPQQPLSGPVVFIVRFYRGSNRRVDGDNLQKLCQDALNGLAWVDDSQVVSWGGTILKADDKGPRTEIEIEELA